MQIRVRVSREEYESGEILKKIDPPVIEFRDKDGWVKRAKLSDLDKLPQFKGSNAEFLSELSGQPQTKTEKFFSAVLMWQKRLVTVMYQMQYQGIAGVS